MPSAPTLLQNVIARGVVAARPAAALAGRLWYATDEGTFYRDNGTTWDELPTGAVDSVDGLTGAVDLTGTYEPIGAADAAVAAHASVTTDVHGITDAVNLVYSEDPRLTDARTPTAHAVSHETGGDDELELAPAQITGTAVVDADARLSDARTPTVHASSHATAGSDPVTPSAIGAETKGTGIAMAIVFGG